MSDSDQKPKIHQTSYLVPIAPGGEIGPAVAIVSDVAAIEAKTEGYQERAHASNTRRAYKADWEHFEAWSGRSAILGAASGGRTALPHTARRPR